MIKLDRKNSVALKLIKLAHNYKQASAAAASQWNHQARVKQLASLSQNLDQHTTVNKSITLQGEHLDVLPSSRAQSSSAASSHHHHDEQLASSVEHTMLGSPMMNLDAHRINSLKNMSLAGEDKTHNAQPSDSITNTHNQKIDAPNVSSLSPLSHHQSNPPYNHESSPDNSDSDELDEPLQLDDYYSDIAKDLGEHSLEPSNQAALKPVAPPEVLPFDEPTISVHIKPKSDAQDQTNQRGTESLIQEVHHTNDHDSSDDQSFYELTSDELLADPLNEVVHLNDDNNNSHDHYHAHLEEVVGDDAEATTCDDYDFANDKKSVNTDSADLLIDYLDHLIQNGQAYLALIVLSSVAQMPQVTPNQLTRYAMIKHYQAANACLNRHSPVLSDDEIEHLSHNDQVQQWQQLMQTISPLKSEYAVAI